jgi:3-oxoacyl-[acyl-carrier protein] reductase
MNKTAFITGASRGIGRAIAETLARDGFNIIIGYNRSEAEAESLAASIAAMGVRVIAVRGDIGDYVCVKNMFSDIHKVFPRVDVLVNNAGIALVKPLLDTTPEEWRNIISTNLDSIYNTTKFVLPEMGENGFGRIINISSIWGEIGASCEVAYSASKAALHGFTKALAKEVKVGITVNCIAPGIIDTDMNSDLSASEIQEFLLSVPARRMGKASEVAALAAFLASDKSAYINGQIIGINGGIC